MAEEVDALWRAVGIPQAELRVHAGREDAAVGAVRDVGHLGGRTAVQSTRFFVSPPSRDGARLTSMRPWSAEPTTASSWCTERQSKGRSETLLKRPRGSSGPVAHPPDGIIAIVRSAASRLPAAQPGGSGSSSRAARPACQVGTGAVHAGSNWSRSGRRPC